VIEQRSASFYCRLSESRGHAVEDGHPRTTYYRSQSDSPYSKHPYRERYCIERRRMVGSGEPLAQVQRTLSARRPGGFRLFRPNCCAGRIAAIVIFRNQSLSPEPK
jgi:hypothetical protein